MNRLLLTIGERKNAEQEDEEYLSLLGLALVILAVWWGT